MPLLNRKRVILAKVESVYGTDASPAATDAVLCRNINITPLEGDIIGRDLVRPYLGHSEQIQVRSYVSLEVEVELAGAGAAGTAPKWGGLLRACGFSQTVLGAAHTGTAQAGAASTITLAAGASGSDDTYKHMTIRITDGTGNGQSRVIKGYVGVTRVATVTENWTTAPDATSTYSIDAQVVYAPVSASFESATIHFNLDGVRHVLLGARGNVSFRLAARELPVMRFRFMGLLGTITDTALPSTDYTAWVKPVPVDTTNTTGLSLHGWTGALLGTVDIDIANSVVHRLLVGGESVIITDRKPAGSISIEAPLVAAQDFFTKARNSTTGAFSITHGPTTNRVKIDAPKLQFASPRYEEEDGIAMLNTNLVFIPNGTTGNDEITVSVL